MSLSQGDANGVVTMLNVQFGEMTLQVSLSDGRQVSLPLDTVSWLNWLHTASPEQRDAWTIEPGG